MFSSNPAKSLGEKAVGGKGVEMADKANTLATEAKSQAEMANKAKNLASEMKSQADKADKVATEMKSQAEMADRAQNLAGEFGSQGLSSTGGVGLGSTGLGNTDGIGASSPGIGGQSVNTLRTGAGNTDRSNPHASGYGGHTTNIDSHGRDTSNSETCRRVNTNTGTNGSYSMSSDRDRLREQGNTGTGTTFGTSDLARGTGTGPHHHATGNELGTSSTRTGIHSGDGIHSQQYYGRTDDGSTYVSGASTGVGHHPHANGHHGTGVGHHQAGEGIHARQYTGRSGGTSTSETVSGMGSGIGHHDHHHRTDEGHHNLTNECEFCHRGHSVSQRDTTVTGTAVPASYSTQDKNKNLKLTSSGDPPSSGQERNIDTTSKSTNVPTSSASTNQNNLPGYGETIMTTTTSTNTTEGPSPYHLRPGETIVEKETRVHRGVPSGTGTGTVHRSSVTGISQPTTGQINPEGSVGQPQQRRKASMGEKLMDKMSGKTHSNVDPAEEAARTVNPSRN